jgi:hypothetical protein
MTAASPATARTAIFGSCASDDFLNPLVWTIIEIPMISVLFWVSEYSMWGRLSNDSEQNFAIGREIFLIPICGNGLASKKCGEFFTFHKGDPSACGWILRPQSPKQQFLIGFVVLSIVAGIGPKLAGSRAMTGRPGTLASTPARRGHRPDGEHARRGLSVAARVRSPAFRSRIRGS